MHILIVEDDPFQAGWIEKIVRNGLRNTEVSLLRTEAEFRTFLSDASLPLPDVIVVDVILPWAFPGQDASAPPPEVKDNGRRRAGLRCQKMLHANQRTQTIPVVLYTVLEEADLEGHLADLPANVIYLNKTAAPEPLIKAINDLIRKT